RPGGAGGEGAPEPGGWRARIVKILARVQEPPLLEALTSAASEMSAELIVVGGPNGDSGEQQLLDALRSHPAIVFVEAGIAGSLKRLREETRARSSALVVACATPEEVQQAVDARVDEWVL